MHLRGIVFRLFLCFVAAIFVGPPGHAQPSGQWPQRPVRFIIPLGPGSGKKAATAHRCKSYPHQQLRIILNTETMSRIRPFIVEKLKKHLQSLNIYTLGRFGEWEYVNSDNCIWRGMNLAKRLSGDSHEALPY